MELNQEDIWEFLRRTSRNSPEPYPAFFDDACCFHNYDAESSSSHPSDGDSPSLTMFSASPLSHRSQDSHSETSSAATPDPPLSSSPRFDILDHHLVRDSVEDLDGLRGFDDRLTTPQLDKHELPRPTRLDILGPAKPARTRVLQNVNKINEVRDTGAFTSFHRKNEDAFKDILRNSRPEFDDHLFEGQIFLDRSCTGVALPACLKNFTCKTPGTNTITHMGCTFSRSPLNPALSQSHLLEWAERSLSPEEFSTFEGGIESFIGAYLKLGYSGQRPQLSLLEKVHKFKSAYKICRAPTLFFLQQNGKAAEELPLPAQAELRGVARAALESSERDILSELDRYLKTPKISDQDRPAVWAALWQLMFVYRDLLRNVRPWRNNAEALFNAVAVFYATLFRTKAALKSLEEVKSAWLPNDAQRHDLVGAFDHALSLRDTFYQSIVAGIASIDERLKILVVDPEMKVLNRRATNKKPAGAKRGAAHSHDGDEVMGGC
ncbi:hypothetical protein COL26b_005079 [Colletotrichum chrysophilum]|uniref:uncharacterized protein n=1 Tax=Colletotrichum chrysophilum TaxID=1836956 RepID=UPI002301262F|nr:uncharacterized protein COL26b_005079 [Colletotrichum chrysophilum]KAJ0344983.1 hypothetical protein KNSL1_008871 [Colletotrichum chrysophilum]KAJ0376618.1 hypothetical protein COL26b_005079 [Colletotrichum chrysophilum]